MKIDDTDRLILNELMKESRLSMSELGRRVNLSAPSVTERVRRMESFRLIKRYTLELDYEKIEQPIQCIIEATVKNDRSKTLRNIIQTMPNVEFCYRISGKACYMMKLQFKSFSEVEAFIDQIAPYAHTVTHFIFSEVETTVQFDLE